MSDAGNAAGGESADPPAGDLATRVEVLREENRRLREEHRRLVQRRYRRSALGFLVLAVLAVGGALVLATARDVLLGIAAIAGFAGLLTYYLTPEKFLPASVGESVYGAVARTRRDLIDDLGLDETRLYLPDGNGAVKVFLPLQGEYEVPDLDARDGVVVVPEAEQARGLAVWPTGLELFDAFQRVASEPGSREHVPEQLTEVLVEQFELADGATVDSREPGRITFAVSGSAYSGVDRVDHPVGSFLATGLASTLDTPVELDTTTAEDSQAGVLVTCRWNENDVDGSGTGE